MVGKRKELPQRSGRPATRGGSQSGQPGGVPQNKRAKGSSSRGGRGRGRGRSGSRHSFHAGEGQRRAPSHHLPRRDVPQSDSDEEPALQLQRPDDGMAYQSLLGSLTATAGRRVSIAVKSLPPSKSASRKDDHQTQRGPNLTADAKKASIPESQPTPKHSTAAEPVNNSKSRTSDVAERSETLDFDALPSVPASDSAAATTTATATAAYSTANSNEVPPTGAPDAVPPRASQVPTLPLVPSPIRSNSGTVGGWGLVATAGDRADGQRAPADVGDEGDAEVADAAAASPLLDCFAAQFERCSLDTIYGLHLPDSNHLHWPNV